MGVTKERIISPKVKEPPPKTWSQALKVGNLLFISGQVAVNADGQLVGRGDITAQAVQTFEYIKALVEQAGGTMDDIVKLTIYLTDMRDRPKLLEIREKYFTGDFPTSTLVMVSMLAFEGLLIEIDAIGVLPD